MGKPTFEQRLAKITAAHTDLTIFHAVTKIMEGGTLYDNKSHKAAAKIITICNHESARHLRVLDAGRSAFNAQGPDQ